MLTPSDLIYGTFSGVATAASDEGNTLGLGAGIGAGDVVRGYLSFDSLLVSSPVDGCSMNNLSITINDVNTIE